MDMLESQTTPRMHRHFEDELEKLRSLLIRMGSLVDEQIELASKAVLIGDEESARFVLKREVRVNEYDLMVDALSQRILALTQPVAIDLRTLIAAMRLDSEFERIGDIAVNIAERVTPLKAYAEMLERTGLKPLIEEAQRMSRAAFDAFINSDVTMARSLFDREDNVDRMARRSFDLLLADMKSDSKLVEPGAHAMGLLRHVERLADHATNIAEDVIFIVEAKMLKHQSSEAIFIKEE